MPIKKCTPLIAVALLFSWSQCALAHGPEKGSAGPQHGGQYVEHEAHHGIEMVAENNTLVFHLTEHLKPQNMKGSVFKVFVQTKTGMKSMPAKPQGTTLVVEMSGRLPHGSKIVLTGKNGDGHTIQARFTQK